MRISSNQAGSGRRAFGSLCVFCGSSSGKTASYLEGAREVGLALALRGIELIYGGGKVGLMGAVADAVLGEGGKVIGVIPQSLVEKEVAHNHLTELRIVASMHERKALMCDLAEGFIALPGGFGTFEEYCEMLTWAQLGLHAKPCGILNIGGYFDPLLALFDHAVKEGFLRAEHRAHVLVETEVGRLIDQMIEFQPFPIEKWLGRDET